MTEGWVPWPWLVAAVALVIVFCWAVWKVGKGWEDADGMSELRGEQAERPEGDDPGQP